MNQPPVDQREAIAQALRKHVKQPTTWDVEIAERTLQANADRAAKDVLKVTEAEKQHAIQAALDRIQTLDADRMLHIADWLDKMDDLLAALGEKNDALRQLSEASAGQEMQRDLRSWAAVLAAVSQDSEAS